ncbi:hypothetical protein, partial [Acetomicrobium sp. S15 = DSM 107314]|uniref:hypothetical protein n=1 Tax=Acetomicrobium sp. S15 = DSM 107314 TaxID=2529858 RepID=UPI001E5FB138
FVYLFFLWRRGKPQEIKKASYHDISHPSKGLLRSNMARPIRTIVLPSFTLIPTAGLAKK